MTLKILEKRALALRVMWDQEVEARWKELSGAERKRHVLAANPTIAQKWNERGDVSPDPELCQDGMFERLVDRIAPADHCEGQVLFVEAGLPEIERLDPRKKQKATPRHGQIFLLTDRWMVVKDWKGIMEGRGKEMFEKGHAVMGDIAWWVFSRLDLLYSFALTLVADLRDEMDLDVPTALGPVCAACGEALEVVACCSRCNVQRYCGPQCQKADWPAHKLNCFDFRKLAELFQALPERVVHVGGKGESFAVIDAFYNPKLDFDVSFLPPELKELWDRARKMWNHDLSWFPENMVVAMQIK
jgi:hypothetical protein